MIRLNIIIKIPFKTRINFPMKNIQNIIESVYKILLYSSCILRETIIFILFKNIITFLIFNDQLKYTSNITITNYLNVSLISIASISHDAVIWFLIFWVCWAKMLVQFYRKYCNQLDLQNMIILLDATLECSCGKQRFVNWNITYKINCNSESRNKVERTYPDCFGPYLVEATSKIHNSASVYTINRNQAIRYVKPLSVYTRNVFSNLLQYITDWFPISNT